MGLKEIFVFFLTLALGYMICLQARKQGGVLKTLGYTLGAATIIFTMLYGLFSTQYPCYSKCGYGKPGMGMKMMRHPMRGMPVMPGK